MSSGSKRKQHSKLRKDTEKLEDTVIGSKENPVSEFIESITVAGPGFINFKLTEEGLRREDARMLNIPYVPRKKENETNNNNPPV